MTDAGMAPAADWASAARVGDESVADSLVIAGAGIGGLAAALACARAGCRVQVFEQAAQHVEYGAGIQLGPNVTRVLRSWGMLEALQPLAGHPLNLRVRDVAKGREIACMPLGKAMQARYGAPYLTVHRRDLHQLLAQQLEQMADVQVHLCSGVFGAQAMDGGGVAVQLDSGRRLSAPALVGADGIWSVVRSAVPAAAHDAPRPSGHLALRALVPGDHPAARALIEDSTVWVGRRHHIVTYPVRGAALLNVAAFVEMNAQSLPAAGAGWSAQLPADEVMQAMQKPGHAICDPVIGLLEAAVGWGMWNLHTRSRMSVPEQMVHGPVALLGDAAHPTLPYLAQGAGMAIEDAAVLARYLQGRQVPEWPAALQSYAQARHARCARIQARSARNGQAFHATGLVRLARDLVLSALGPRIMDLPWLYGWQVESAA